jgi:transposase
MADASNLPSDVEELRRLVLLRTAERDAAKAGLLTKALEVEKLKVQIARLRRKSFGASSERVRRELEQLELKLEEIETAEAQAEAAQKTAAAEEPAQSAQEEAPPKKQRRKLPEALPRREIVHEPACACPACGGAMRKVGEDVTEILDYIPGRFEVVRHIRPAYSCRKCEAMAQKPMPSLPIPRAQAGAGLLAHVLIAKFCDHLPLYRQAEIYSRRNLVERLVPGHFLELPAASVTAWTSTAPRSRAGLARPLGWLNRSQSGLAATSWRAASFMPMTRPCRFLRPATARRRKAGSGSTFATSVRTPARRRRRCSIATRRIARASAAAATELYKEKEGKPASVTEVACWAHVRRKFFDEHKSHGSPIAGEALAKIGELFDIERVIAGKPPGQRQAARMEKAKPKLDALGTWMDAQLQLIPGKSDLAGAIRYARSRWEALTCYRADGRLEISNNAAENAVRPVSLGRKNWLFAGSDAGGERAAIFYTLIRSAKMNGLEPEAYLRDVLIRIGEHPINAIDALLPWNIAKPALSAAA